MPDRPRGARRRRSALLALAGCLVLPGVGLAQEASPSGSPMPQDTTAPVQPGGILPGEPQIQLVQVATGLVDPVNVADDGSGRVFVVERPGLIRIIDTDGTLLEEPFLDIQGSVKTDFLEQGLLGLAFAPDYAESGYFYVYYADYATNGNLRIVRYEVSDDANVADEDSATLVLEIANDPYINHNGGTIRFGPDGMLYWTTGDGGLAGDPYDNAQDRRNPFGKIHRIDVTPDGDAPYAIPEDNPFAQSGLPQLSPEDPAAYHPGAERTIWAWGLRNPWQFSFDNETGDLYIADVGQNAWEEIDVQAAGTPGGQNYGWDWLEGSHCYPESITDCPRQQLGVLPVAEYDHTAGDCSITGLGVYRGETSTALDGIYFASDFCSGRVWGLARDDAGSWVFQELLDTALLVPGGGSTSDGEVYLTSCECRFGRDYDPFAEPSGSLWRVVSADQVPDGATTAPPEPVASPAASPAAPEETTPAAGEGSAAPSVAASPAAPSASDAAPDASEAAPAASPDASVPASPAAPDASVAAPAASVAASPAASPAG